MPDLPPGVDADVFRSIYSIPDSKTLEPTKKIVKIFPKKPVPSWLKSLGQIRVDDKGNNVLVINESLISLVAGCDGSLPLQFGLFSSVDLLHEIILLGNEGVPEAPTIHGYKGRSGWQVESLKSQLKAIFCMFAMANNMMEKLVENPEFLNNVVLPGLKNLVESIQSLVRHMRFEALPKGVPMALKYKFVDAPMHPLWPAEETNEIRQFFLRRFKTGQRGSQGRGRSRFNQGRFQRFRTGTGRVRRGWGGRRGRGSAQKGENASNKN